MEQRTTKELIELYVSQGELMGIFRKKTVKNKKGFFKALLDFLDGRELTADLAIEYSLKLASDGKSPGSIRNILKNIRAFVNWEETNEYIPKSYSRKIKMPPEPKNQKLYPSVDVALRVIEAGVRPSPFDNCIAKSAKQTARIALAFDLCTGIRNAELRSLLVKDFDFDTNNYSFIRKGGNQTTLGLPPNMIDEMKQWCSQKKPEERVFPIYPDTLNIILKRGSKEIGLATPLTCHALRHIFASECANKGMPQNLLQNLLGHSKFETTAKYYLHASINQQTQALVNYHSLVRKSMTDEQKWDFAEKIISEAKLTELGFKVQINRTSGQIKIEKPN